MCGRFTLTADPADIQDAFPWLEVPAQMAPTYNSAPSQPIAVVPNTGENKLDFFVWGLIPSWICRTGDRRLISSGHVMPLG